MDYYCSLILRDQLSIHTTCMDLKGLVTLRVKATLKGYIPYDSIYIKFLR